MTKREFNQVLDRLAKFHGVRVIEVERQHSRCYCVGVRCVEPGKMLWNCHGKTLIECRTKETAEQQARTFRRWLVDLRRLNARPTRSGDMP